jgi:hypothetical protein
MSSVDTENCFTLGDSLSQILQGLGATPFFSDDTPSLSTYVTLTTYTAVDI